MTDEKTLVIDRVFNALRGFVAYVHLELERAVELNLLRDVYRSLR